MVRLAGPAQESRMATIAVLGTFDTKGEEHGFVAERIRERGHHVLLIDVGTGAAATLTADLSREEVARQAGFDLGAVIARHDRGEAVAAMSQAAPAVLGQLYGDGKIDGVISLGGGGGTAIATAGMRALPIGFPKLMVSTLASGNTAPYVGEKDIVMMPSIVDVAGLNRVSRQILARAAGAICGMVEAAIPAVEDRPIIVASMFGNTTAVRATGARRAGGGGLRSARLSLHRHRRQSHGSAHRVRHGRRRARYHHHRMGG